MRSSASYIVSVLPAKNTSRWQKNWLLLLAIGGVVLATAIARSRALPRWAGIVYAITPSKTKLAAVGSDGTPKPRAGKGKAAPAKQASFMERLEERWEKRRRDQW